MLVLSRKEGQRIRIGDDIELTISRCRNNRVTVGIEAPEDVRVQRSEVAESAATERSRASREQAAQSVSPLIAANSA